MQAFVIIWLFSKKIRKRIHIPSHREDSKKDFLNKADQSIHFPAIRKKLYHPTKQWWNETTIQQSPFRSHLDKLSSFSLIRKLINNFWCTVGISVLLLLVHDLEQVRNSEQRPHNEGCIFWSKYTLCTLSLHEYFHTWQYRQIKTKSCNFNKCVFARLLPGENAIWSYYKCPALLLWYQCKFWALLYTFVILIRPKTCSK